MSEEKDKIIPLEAVLVKFNEQKRNFIDGLEKEEGLDRVETTESIQNDIKGDRVQTDRKKLEFIKELKTELSDKIKSNPGRVKIIKKKWHVRLKLFLKEIFTRF